MIANHTISRFLKLPIGPVLRENIKGLNNTPYIVSYDKNFKNYIINKLEIKFLQTKTINKVFVKSLNKGYDLLIYGVFA